MIDECPETCTCGRALGKSYNAVMTRLRQWREGRRAFRCHACNARPHSFTTTTARLAGTASAASPRKHTLTREDCARGARTVNARCRR